MSPEEALYEISRIVNGAHKSADKWFKAYRQIKDILDNTHDFPPFGTPEYFAKVEAEELARTEEGED